jgi:hypothetical protein
MSKLWQSIYFFIHEFSILCTVALVAFFGVKIIEKLRWFGVKVEESVSCNSLNHRPLSSELHWQQRLTQFNQDEKNPTFQTFKANKATSTEKEEDCKEEEKQKRKKYSTSGKTENGVEEASDSFSCKWYSKPQQVFPAGVILTDMPSSSGTAGRKPKEQLGTKSDNCEETWPITHLRQPSCCGSPEFPGRRQHLPLAHPFTTNHIRINRDESGYDTVF